MKGLNVSWLSFMATIALLSVLVTGSQAVEEYTTLRNKGIHTFQNRHDSGFLTAINVRTPASPIVTDIWRDAVTQKWRDVSALLAVAYQLKPLSNEDKVMEYDYRTGMVYQDNAGLGMGNSQYWQFVYVGQGFHLIKNYKTGECLQSSGLGQPVGVAPCASIPRQQWAVKMM